MQRDQILALRLASSEQYGDERFDDPDIQKSLLFEKAGDVIFDRLGLNLAYFYPSAIGSSLFFYGEFEGGEIDVVAHVLRQTPRPVVIDVGANIGVHTLAWAEAVPDSEIHAFEPAPRNYALLERNVRAHGLEERVHVTQCALGASSARALLHETDDAAYSSVLQTRRRPITSRYEVDMTPLDRYVRSRDLAGVDLVKIDVEGYEDEVLRGATDTIARFKPHVFVEISAENQNEDPEATVRRLQDAGYRPYVINDGVIMPYGKHDDRFYNYLFLHQDRKVTLPLPNPVQIHKVIARLQGVIVRQRAGVAHVSKEMQGKEAEIRRMKIAADERLELINRLESAAKGAAMNAVTQAETLHAEVLRLGQLAEGRLRLVEALREENADLLTRCQTLESELDLQRQMFQALSERASVEGLQQTVQAQSEEIQRLHKAATERLRVIEEFQRHVDYLRSQQAPQQVHEFAEHERKIAQLTAELENQRAELVSKDLLIAKLDEFMSVQRAESDDMRRVANERLIVIEDLNKLASERLEVIRGLSERLHSD